MNRVITSKGAVKMTKICPECGLEFTTNRSARTYCSKACSNRVISRERENSKPDVPAKSVWSCGGGVQSTAIAALICTGRLPKPDYAIMTDVGHEKQATFEYVRKHMIPRLADAGVTLHIINSADYVSTSVLDSTGHVRLPAYTKDSNGKVIKFHTHCSGTWKGKVARQWMREQGIERAENWIGISQDEARRARESEVKWVTLRYPLIELGITREDCLWIISESGWPRPPRTSCYFCPLQDDASWLRTKQQYPEDWQRCIDEERQIQAAHPGVYLHRSLVPIDQVEFKMTWREMMTECTTAGVQCWG